MKIYLAGNPKAKPRDIREHIDYKLWSYYHEKKQAIEWGSEGQLLDSGAFTAWTKGVEIDIDELIAFIKLHKPENAIQLDVIGKEEETWENYRYMTSKGVEVLPVIHYKASEKHIKRVVKKADYICLGGLVPLARRKKKLQEWLDYIFTFEEIRKVKVHCLGITTRWVLERYPFYSVDSTSYLSIFRYPQSDSYNKVKQKVYSRQRAVLEEIDKTKKLEKYITELWKRRGIIFKD